MDERGDAWVLTTGDGTELAITNTLGECGLHDRDVVVLERRGAAPRTAVPDPSRAVGERASRATKSHQAKPAHRKRPVNATGRVLSERTARTLPPKLTVIERVRETLRALRGDESSVIATPQAPAGVPAFGCVVWRERAERDLSRLTRTAT